MIKDYLITLSNYVYTWIWPSKAMILKGRPVTISHYGNRTVYYLTNETDELNLPDNKKFIESDVKALVQKIDAKEVQDGDKIDVCLMQYVGNKTHLSYDYIFQKQNGELVFLKKERLWD